MKFKTWLNERTLSVDIAVDYIYNKYYRSYFKKLKDYKGGAFPQKPENVVFSSNVLSSLSQDIKDSNKTKPVLINLNAGTGNSYRPDSMIGEISLQINSSFLKFIDDHSHLAGAGGLETLALLLPTNAARKFMSDLSGDKIRTTIAHELSHWVGDALQNDKITKIMSRAKSDISVVYQGHTNVALTDYEIDAQIHQFKELKRLHADKWNSLSFEDTIKLDGSLYHIYETLSKVELKLWKKLVRKRLFREKLLGKKMNK